MRHLLLLTIVLLLAGLSFVLYRWPRGAQYSFSQHAAQTKSASIFYALLFLITSPILVLYFGFWFIPTFQAPQILLYVIILVGIFQVACTLAPERGSKRRVLAHRLLAGVSGALLLPAAALIFLSSIDEVAKIIVLIGGITMLFVVTYILAHGNKLVTWRLQLVYYSGFLLPLAWVTYASA